MSFSQEGLHAPPQLVLELPPIELWRQSTEDFPPTPSAESIGRDSNYSSDSGTFLLRPQFFQSNPQPWSTSRIITRLFFSTLISLLVLVALAQGYSTSYLALVEVTTVNQTVPISLWSPLNDIYHEYTYKVLPVITPIEQDEHAWTPGSVISGLIEEVDEMQAGLQAWEDSSLPGPETFPTDEPLSERAGSLCRRLESLQDSFIFVQRQFPFLASEFTLAVLATTLQGIQQGGASGEHSTPNQTVDAVEAIRRALELMEEENEAILVALQRIDRELRPVLDQVDFFSNMVSQGLSPHLNQRFWIPNAVDAADYTLGSLLPMAHLVSNLTSIAAASMVSADALLGTAVGHYTMLGQTHAYVEETWLRRVELPVGGMFAQFEEQRVQSQYIFDNSVIQQLGQIMQHGRLMSHFLEVVDEGKDKDINWTYSKVRPPRPGKVGLF